MFALVTPCHPVRAPHGRAALRARAATRPTPLVVACVEIKFARPGRAEVVPVPPTRSMARHQATVRHTQRSQHGMGGSTLEVEGADRRRTVHW